VQINCFSAIVSSTRILARTELPPSGPKVGGPVEGFLLGSSKVGNVLGTLDGTDVVGELDGTTVLGELDGTVVVGEPVGVFVTGDFVGFAAAAGASSAWPSCTKSEIINTAKGIIRLAKPIAGIM